MKAQTNKMDIISNNIANADTNGYKKDSAIIQSFSEELAKKVKNERNASTGFSGGSIRNIGRMSLGVYLQNIFTDFNTGALKNSGGSLDFAIDGDGFFCALRNGEEVYTRDGSFTYAADGTIVAKDGYPVVLADDGAPLVRNFANNNSLLKIGGNFFARGETTEEVDFTGRIVNGFLEGSNVNSVKEMVDMISLSRAFDANQRIITVHDQTLGRAVNDVARRQ
jgi:flagellar basal-body rod protein FlgG